MKTTRLLRILSLLGFMLLIAPFFNACEDSYGGTRYITNAQGTPSGARLRRVSTYFCKLNKAFKTRIIKIYYHKVSILTLQKTELSSS